MVTSAYQGTLRSKHLETYHAALCLQIQAYQEEQQQNGQGDECQLVLKVGMRDNLIWGV